MKSAPQIHLILRFILAGLVGLLSALLWVAGCASPTGFEPGAVPAAVAIPATMATPTPIPTQLPTVTYTTPTAQKSSTPFPTQATTSPTAIQTCQEAGGQTIDQTLPTDLRSAPLAFKVYLPPCYADNPDRRYPVLYLLHGQTYTDNQWVRLGATTTADRLINNGVISPFLIVMPDETEWLPPDQTKFGDVLVNELVPWIDRQYRTLSDRKSRAIGGLSRGAAWALHLGLTRWDIFGEIGAHSLPIFWNDSDQLDHWLDAIPASDMPRIYLDIGRSDADLPSALSFENLLNARNIPHEWHLQPGYHTEEYWQAHIEEYLRWYAANW